MAAGFSSPLFLFGVGAPVSVTTGGRPPSGGRRVVVPQTQRRTITGPQTITLPSVTDVALEAFDRAFGQLVMYGEAEGVIALESSSVASGQMFMYGEVEESSQDAVDGASGRITFNLEEQLDDMEQVAWDLFIEKKDNRLLAALRRARR